MWRIDNTQNRLGLEADLSGAVWQTGDVAEILVSAVVNIKQPELSMANPSNHIKIFVSRAVNNITAIQSHIAISCVILCWVIKSMSCHFIFTMLHF